MILPIEFFARGGGGGSSGGGGGGGLIVLPFVIAGAIVAYFRRKKQLKKAAQAYEQAKANDPSWNSVVDRAKTVFTMFEKDWSEFNIQSMSSYLTPRYHQHIALMLEALKQMGRQNIMTNVNLEAANLFEVNDSPENEHDSFDIEMVAQATDRLITVQDGATLFLDETPFIELWRFERDGPDWKLAAIFQSEMETAIEKGFTENSAKKAKVDAAAKMKSFAQQNGFFYNADFGWLLLPQGGVLFTISSFGRSDINFHTIGRYNGVLVQFYQYVPVVPDKRQWNDYLWSIYRPAYRIYPYTVAQTVLPKSYDNIVIKRKNRLGLTFTPAGMTQVSLEGVDFNDKFSVYATDTDKVSSLELLNPAYMQKLIDAPFEVNIEIYGNVLYLYSPDNNADFGIMLGLLKNAFEEMRM